MEYIKRFPLKIFSSKYMIAKGELLISRMKKNFN